MMSNFRLVPFTVMVVCLFDGMSNRAWALSSPEMNPESVASAVTLLAGGLFLLSHSVYRRKVQ
ncbi:MAG: hypothetical protein EBV06_06655 [Planctomycetia bacterium]|nr:hypothetical protein [Planctomycetia bacterium]